MCVVRAFFFNFLVCHLLTSFVLVLLAAALTYTLHCSLISTRVFHIFCNFNFSFFCYTLVAVWYAVSPASDSGWFLSFGLIDLMISARPLRYNEKTTKKRQKMQTTDSFKCGTFIINPLKGCFLYMYSIYIAYF